MKLSDYVVKFVADLGVGHCFLVTGGGAMHLNQSLANEKRITPVCNSHEQASSICAENYAKATGGLGVALVSRLAVKNRSVVPIRVSGARWSRDLLIIRRAGVPLSPAADRLRAMLLARRDDPL